MRVMTPIEKEREKNNTLYSSAGQKPRNTIGAANPESFSPRTALGSAVANAQAKVKELARNKANTLYSGNGQETEDGLSKMIQEAQGQTDALATPQKSWVDDSYTTWKPATDTVRGDKYISEKAGQLYTDGGGQNWMHTWDGSMTLIDGKSQSEIDALKKQQLNRDYKLTGRVYKVNPDGNAPQWLSIGDQVVTGGGTYVINGHKSNGYHSVLIDPNQTTENYTGNYNTGIYGSILGEQNGNLDSFKGNRESAGEYTGYGGYSYNRGNGQVQFDTVSFTADGEWTRAAVQNGIPYKLNAQGILEPLEAGSLIQDASQRYWIVGADGSMIDVTPKDPKNSPYHDPTVKQLQRQQAEAGGIKLKQDQPVESTPMETGVDAATQAKIDQWNLQLERERQSSAAANRQLYRQYRLGQQQLGEQLVGAGLQTTGANEVAQANLTADYIAAMNANQQGLRTAEEDTEAQIQLATLQAQQEAADKALAEERELQARLLQAQQQAQADKQNAEQTAREDAWKKAGVLAQYGDFSGYAELGYTPEQIAGMQAAYEKETTPDTGFSGISNYAMTLLELYEANPDYNIQAGLQTALDSGLITQQDYTAALQLADGLKGNHQQNTPAEEPYAGLSGYAMTLLELYEANPGFDIQASLQQALDSGLITQQDYTAAIQTADGLKGIHQQNTPGEQPYAGLSDYALTLLELYEVNPDFDIQASLQQALNSGLITQQDYTAAIQTADGLKGIHQQNTPGAQPYAGLSDYAMTLLNLYMANPKYDVNTALQQALQNGLITQQDYTAALQAAAGLKQ